jgi:hypothetical protein
MDTSGFTRDEINAIQFPDSYVDERASVPVPVRINARNTERERVQAHFATLVPTLQSSTANSVETILAQLGDRVMQAPPAVR